ncbi:DUF3737 family protein [Coprobacillus sp. AF33-1AC]|uniref:DUF3737 family protein n=1 Tax=Coprobacillus sp. AF33-1AC TaxID=2292032 RepID=UPI000E48963B|nr:DUF3737 family protein [Coprobacillus sp. AF33-1AC]RHM63542.1 DUF3737 family protein [Coprobacillus sp. AF33-1AC]
MNNTVVKQQKLIGERALFQSHHIQIEDSVFEDGESPLKESQNIDIKDTIFKWKYPLWYCQNVSVNNSTLLETARSGIWYTHHIDIKDSVIDAPKTFRRSTYISLDHVNLLNSQETLWNCQNIKINAVQAKGDYFGMNSENIEINDLRLSGNYCFDGGKNIVVRNSKLISKDAFWNCENITIYDSVIIGEYLAWNTKNITFINCTIESLQGLCYIEGLKMINCKLINTNLAFEFCKDIDVEINSHIDSITHPLSGTIRAKSIGEIIMDEKDNSDVNIIVEEE